MADLQPIVNPEPTPATLSSARLPEPLSKGEKEAFEAKIAELEAKIVELESELERFRNPPKLKKKSLLERFAP